MMLTMNTKAMLTMNTISTRICAEDPNMESASLMNRMSTESMQKNQTNLENLMNLDPCRNLFSSLLIAYTLKAIFLMSTKISLYYFSFMDLDR